MFIAIYRWQVKPGMDDQFQEGWRRVTLAIRANCGSYGSRLHLCSDGSWLGYAQWPDAATRAACNHGEEEGGRMMSEAILASFEEILGEVALDLLMAMPG